MVAPTPGSAPSVPTTRSAIWFAVAVNRYQSTVSACAPLPSVPWHGAGASTLGVIPVAEPLLLPASRPPAHESPRFVRSVVLGRVGMLLGTVGTIEPRELVSTLFRTSKVK